MEFGRIAPDLTWSAFVAVRLLRRWAASIETEANPLPAMIGLAQELGQEASAAIALHSLFQFAEAALGRRLEAECCCSQFLSRDKQVILALLAVSPGHRLPFAPQVIPHGLPGALRWAIASARIALAMPVEVVRPPARCPF